MAPDRTPISMASFPVQHWKKIWSTNPLERVKQAIEPPPTGFPNPAALLRLVGCPLIEVPD